MLEKFVGFWILFFSFHCSLRLCRTWGVENAKSKKYRFSISHWQCITKSSFTELPYVAFFARAELSWIFIISFSSSGFREWILSSLNWCKTYFDWLLFSVGPRHYPIECLFRKHGFAPCFFAAPLYTVYVCGDRSNLESLAELCCEIENPTFDTVWAYFKKNNVREMNY